MHANNGSNSSGEQVLRGSGRGPGFIARVEAEGLLHPGRGVNARGSASDNRDVVKREGMRDTGKRVRCYACGDLGHVARACTATDGSGWKRISSGNGPRVRESSHAGPRQ